MILRGFLDVQPSERRNTFAAFATLLVITMGHTLLETARDALFLSKLPASQLPWMYLVIVVLALGLAQLKKADNKSAIAGVLTIAALVTGGFYFLAHNAADHKWVLYALYVWSGLFASWVTVQFWTLLGRIHTVTQAKRLYGFIGAGAVLGAVLGAFAARGALAFVSARSMLVASAALFVVAVVPVLAVRIPTEETPEGRDSRPEKVQKYMATGARLLWSNAFARRVLAIALVSIVAVTLTDFLFKSRVATEFKSTRDLAAWLSTFYAITNTISLVAQLFVGPWIFRTFGVQRALFFFPILLLFASGGVLATGGLLTAAVLIKGLDGALRYSVHRTSMELLLVPIPDGTRERIKPIIELVGTRGGQALASLAILILVAVGVGNTLVIGAFVFTLAVVWFALVISIRGHYLDVFRETLRAGGLSGNVQMPELDLGALELLFAHLNSSRDMEVLSALELLAEQDRARLIPALILYHPSRDVVLRSLELFIQRGRTDFVPIADRLNGHPDRQVAAAALRARTIASPDRKLLEARLNDKCAQVSATALIALIEREWIGKAAADERIQAILATKSWSTVAELARAIRDLARDPEKESPAVRERFDDLLVKLAREAGSFRETAHEGAERETPDVGALQITHAVMELSPDIAIRLEVAKAMAARASKAYLPVLVGMLNRHELRAMAREAIARIDGALDFLDEILAHPDFARDIRVHIPRTMSFFDPATAAKKLTARLPIEPDGAVRFKIIRALVRLRRSHPHLSLEPTVLTEVANSTLDHAAELHQWGSGLRNGGDEPPASNPNSDPLHAAHHILVDLVRDKERHAKQRLFMLLELLYEEDFDSVQRGLRSKNPKTRANSLELIENIVRTPLRTRVMTLVGDQPDDGTFTYEAAIRAILKKGGSTMRTLAEYRALEMGLDAAPGTPIGPAVIETVARRLVDRARDLMTPPEVPLGTGPRSRAPA